MTRGELHRAFREVSAREFFDVPLEEDISVSFSQKFMNKMDKLIMCQKNPFWEYVNTGKKRVAVVAVVLITSFVIALGNEEIRGSMLQLCAEVYEKYNRYYFVGETTTEITHYYQLNYVPEGFEVVQILEDKRYYIVTYTNEDNQTIIFEQWATEEYDYTMDNERLEWSTVILKGKKISLFEDSGDMGAMWMENGYCMHLYYSHCESFEIIKQMIESVQ